jgi:hypothetical protein
VFSYTRIVDVVWSDYFSFLSSSCIVVVPKQ